MITTKNRLSHSSTYDFAWPKTMPLWTVEDFESQYAPHDRVDDLPKGPNCPHCNSPSKRLSTGWTNSDYYLIGYCKCARCHLRFTVAKRLKRSRLAVIEDLETQEIEFKTYKRLAAALERLRSKVPAKQYKNVRLALEQAAENTL